MKSFKLWKKYYINGELLPMLFFRLGGKKIVSDKTQIVHQYKAMTGSTLDLTKPKSFNEKMQWLKLNDRKPIYAIMVDKYEAKRYVASIIGNEYIIPTYGIWDRFDDVDFDSLPNQFVIKCTHDSGGVVIVRDKEQFDKEKVRKSIEHSLKRNYYYSNREWPYKNVKPRILVEKYMDNGHNNLNNCICYDFNGKSKFIFKTEKLENYPSETKAFLDLEGNELLFEKLKCNGHDELDYPKNFDYIMELSDKISVVIDSSHVKTDFYCIEGSVIFSEITYSSDNGNKQFDPLELDDSLGEWLYMPGGFGLICADGSVVLVHPFDNTNSVKNEPNEFQFWCFNGYPKFVSVIFQPHGENLKCTYSMDWERQPFVTSLPRYNNTIIKPKAFQEMLDGAISLSRDMPFLRVDYLVFDGKVYFGELTKFPAGGIVNWDPPEWDNIVGEMLELV